MNPVTFAENFLRQPYPTMGLAPSAVVSSSGPTKVQDGGNGLLQTGQMMWARISSAIPFGWTVDGVGGAIKGGNVAGKAVTVKLGEGVQAANGVVKTVGDTTKQAISSAFSGAKWIIVGLVAVAFIVFAAQVKTLVKS